jgi:hypothetical protein
MQKTRLAQRCALPVALPWERCSHERKNLPTRTRPPDNVPYLRRHLLNTGAQCARRSCQASRDAGAPHGWNIAQHQWVQGKEGAAMSDCRWSKAAAKGIAARVLDILQDADEMHGPNRADYVEMMEGLARVCLARAEVARLNDPDNVYSHIIERGNA